MADTTPNYGFPFQEAGDPPDGASLGADLATAVDSALLGVENKIDAYIGSPTRTVYSSSGTWTKPAGAHRIFLECVGGGGAGGGAGAAAVSQWSFGDGGGGGEYRSGWFNASTFASTVAMTIGAGGTASTGAGGSGGNTSFGTHMTANGGGGGGVRTSSNSANFSSNDAARVGGGGGSGGTLSVPGSVGGSGLGITSTTGIGQRGGDGGASFLGGSQVGKSDSAGSAGRSYGGGGSGASRGGGGSAANGGAGAAGCIIVTVYFS